MLDLAITAGTAFVAGWLGCWGWVRARTRALETECVRKLEAADEQLALERLQLEWRFQDAMSNGVPATNPTPAATFEMYRDSHLARPRSAAPDSSTSRA